MGMFENPSQALGQVRDGAHTALGGGLRYKIVTAKGTRRVEAKAPDGYFVTGGGWYGEELGYSPGPKGSYPSSDGKGWTVESEASLDKPAPGLPGHADPRGKRTSEDVEFTVYAVCVQGERAKD